MNEIGILVRVLFVIVTPQVQFTSVWGSNPCCDSLTQSSQNRVGALSDESAHLVFASHQLPESGDRVATKENQVN